MPSKKITELELASSITTDDLILVVDQPAGTPVSKKASVATLAAIINASPTFTGTVTAPLTTAGVVTTTSVGVLGSTASATAATADTFALRTSNGYVVTSGVQTTPPPANITGTTYTVGATDTSLVFAGTATCTVTLPSASTFSGRILYLKTIAAFTVVSASSNVLPLNSNTAGTAILSAVAGSWTMLHSNGTSWVKMCGS